MYNVSSTKSGLLGFAGPIYRKFIENGSTPYKQLYSSLNPTTSEFVIYFQTHVNVYHPFHFDGRGEVVLRFTRISRFKKHYSEG